ncbi:MAG: glycerate kinase [Candidatus Hodarchaeota archaeon]
MTPYVNNAVQLLGNAHSSKDRSARRTALDIIEAILESVNPEKAIRRHIRLEKEKLSVNNYSVDLAETDRIFVVGAGKASGAMATAIEKILGDRINDGIVNVLEGTKDKYTTHSIELNEAGHPIPTESGVRGAQRIIELADSAGDRDIVICLVSGGGSALLPLPSPPVKLKEKQELTDLLLRSGANIKEINTVRKHISRIKGGQLATKAYPATMLTLIISDVVGDPLDVISSGPTVPDSSTFADALRILRKYELWSNTPKSIQARLKQGLEGRIPETPKQSDPGLQKVHNQIIASGNLAIEAAEQEGKKSSLNTLILSSHVEGEAKHFGTFLAAIAREIVLRGNPIKRPALLIAGGETTVTLTGQGNGGRNQAVALSAALGIDGLDGVVVFSLATDGIDGNSVAAGAIVDGTTIYRARKLDLDPDRYLKENAEYHFFEKVGDSIITGPTGTNVNDLMIIVAV